MRSRAVVGVGAVVGMKQSEQVYTHKSLKGNNFATPPSTMKAATAKFTMRLQYVSHEEDRMLRGQDAAAWQSCSFVELQDRKYVQDIREIHVGAGEMWIPQFGDR